ncbi:MAG: polyamine ABC transporter substrate-binding protein [Pontibacterium sp.]
MIKANLFTALPLTLLRVIKALSAYRLQFSRSGLPLHCATAVASCALCIPPAWADALKLINWESYLAPEVIELWQQESGISINEIYIDNDKGRDAILTQSQHSLDLAVIDEVTAETLGNHGELVKLTEAQVPNLTHMGEFWRKRCGAYSVPYFWGTLGLIYRSDVVQQPPLSWRDILVPSPALQGHIGMLDDPVDLIAPALFHLGYLLSTESQPELKQAFNTLVDQAPHVLTYDYPITFIETSKLADKLHMAVAYGGDHNTINDNLGKPGLWQYSIPQEGTVLWVDCLAVLSKSKNREQALAFINFLSRPDVAAKNALAIKFATPNMSALTLLPKDITGNPSLYPPQDILSRSALYEPISKENIELRARIANSVIYAHEARKTR